MLGRSGMNRIIAVLVVLLMGSSWQIIVHQHEIRKLNIELEKEKGRYNDLKLEYQRLELQNSKDNATEHVDAIEREKEEIEAAKKAAKNPVKPPVTTPVVGETKEEPKKEEVKKEPVKVETAKKEIKVEEKSTIKPVAKAEPSKTEAKPTPKVEALKPVAKKADPMDDQLGEFIKKHESKSKN